MHSQKFHTPSPIGGSALALLFLLLVGCAAPLELPPANSAKPAVRDLDILRLQIPVEDPPGVSLDTAIDSYRRFAGIARSSAARGDAMRRMGDLLSERADTRENSTERRVDLLNAVGAYRVAYEDLAQHCREECTDRDDLLYQMARLQGEKLREPVASLETLTRLVKQHPSSAHFAEAQFRRGEDFFARRLYSDAADAYRASLAAKLDPALVEDATYRLAWASYRIGDFDQAAKLIAALLDSSIAEQSSKPGLDRAGCLSTADDSRVGDYMRRMAMALYRSGGVKSIARLADHGMWHQYELCLHMFLADLYESQQQPLLAANTLSSLLDRADAQREEVAGDEQLSARVVELYRAAGEQEATLGKEATHVARFGPNADSDGSPGAWSETPKALRAKRYVDDLAKQYGDRAIRGDVAAYPLAVQWAQLRVETNSESARKAESLAALVDVYRARVNQASLPARERREALASAIEALLKLVQVQVETGADAAAASLASAVALHFELEDLSEKSDRAAIQDRAVKLGERFMQDFPDHASSWDVMTNLVVWEVGRERYDAAAHWAARLVAPGTKASPRAQADAWSTLATIHGNSGDLVSAQTAYWQWRMLEDKPDARNAATAGWRKATEMLALKAEQEFAWQQASDQWQSIAFTLPNEDAATASSVRFRFLRSLACLPNLGKTIEAARKFLSTDRNTGLALEARGLLAQALWSTQSWDAAAEEYARLAEELRSTEPHAVNIACDSAPRPAAGANTRERAARTSSAEALTHAAEKSANRRPTAIAAWTNLLQRYPTPLEDSIKAMDQIAQLELNSGNKVAHQKWTLALYEAGRDAGDARGATGQTLWATAALKIGADTFSQYREVQLRGDITRQVNLKRERFQAVDKVCRDAYQFGEPQTTSAAAGFMRGGLFEDFAAAWVSQPVPSGKDPVAWREEKYRETKSYRDGAAKIHYDNAVRFRGQVLPDGARRSLEALRQLDPVMFDAARTELIRAPSPSTEGTAQP